MVTRASTTYGELVRIDPDSGAAAETLHPVPLGRLTLAEFKLWRNPQARREVIGQRSGVRRQRIGVFGEIETSLEELRDELGPEVENWTGQGRPRIGFWRKTQFPLPDDNEHEEFRTAVAWMRDRLDRIVSALHPRLRRMIDAES